jgi:hypothetical protein
MKRVKNFIIYFPVILVSIQVLVNIYALVDRPGYYAAGFYLNTFIGTNVLFALFLVAFTFSFNLCQVSRFASVAEILFAVNYLIVQEDNLYNIIFQLIVGIISLVLTYNYFIKKFPLCRISLLHKFFGAVVITGSCAKGLDIFERDIESTVKQQLYARHSGNHP